MFPLADTLLLPVFPSLWFRRNRTTFFYVSVKFPSKQTRASASVNAWHTWGNTRKRSGNKSISCFMTETRPVHGKLDHYVSAGRKRDGYKQLPVSVEFTKYGNTLFRPVN